VRAARFPPVPPVLPLSPMTIITRRANRARFARFRSPADDALSLQFAPTPVRSRTLAQRAPSFQLPSSSPSRAPKQFALSATTTRDNILDIINIIIKHFIEKTVSLVKPVVVVSVSRVKLNQTTRIPLALQRNAGINQASQAGVREGQHARRSVRQVA
jgi:hypothetical protein